MSRTLTALGTVVIAVVGIGVNMWRYPEVQEMARVTPRFPFWAQPLQLEGPAQPESTTPPEGPVQETLNPQTEEPTEPAETEDAAAREEANSASAGESGLSPTASESDPPPSSSTTTGSTLAEATPDDAAPGAATSAVSPPTSDGLGSPTDEPAGNGQPSVVGAGENDSRASPMERPGWTAPRRASDWTPREPRPLTLEELEIRPSLVPVAPSGGRPASTIVNPAPPAGTRVDASFGDEVSSARADSSYEIRPLPSVNGAPPPPRFPPTGAWPQRPIPLYPSTGR